MVAARLAAVVLTAVAALLDRTVVLHLPPCPFSFYYRVKSRPAISELSLPPAVELVGLVVEFVVAIELAVLACGPICAVARSILLL